VGRYVSEVSACRAAIRRLIFCATQVPRQESRVGLSKNKADALMKEFFSARKGLLRLEHECARTHICERAREREREREL